MYKLTCPSCKQVLNSKKDIPAGARVKCPGCAVIIAIAPPLRPASPAPQPAPQPAARPRPRPAPPPLPVNASSAVQAGRPKPSVKPLAKRPARPPVEELDELDPIDEDVDELDDVEDDYDDEPRLSRGRSGRNSGSRRPAKKRGRKASSAGIILLIGGIAVGLLLVVGGGVGAYLILGRVSGASRMAMIQENPSMVMSVNVRQARGGKTYQAFRADVANQPAFLAMEQQLPGLPELFDHLDDVLVSTRMNAGEPNLFGPKTVIALSFSRDVADVMKKATRATENKTPSGVAYTIDNGAMHYVVLGNLVVMANGDAESVVKFANDRNRKLPPQVSAEISRVSSNGFWMVAPIPGNAIPPGMPMNAPGMPPAVADMIRSVEKIRVTSVAIDDMSGTRAMRITAAAVFDDAAAATQMQKAAKDAWTAVTPMLDQVQNLQAAQPGQAMPPVVGKLIQEVKTSLTFESSGNRATASLRISDQTMRELNAAAKNMQPNFNQFPGRPF